MQPTFTLVQARALMPALRQHVSELVVVRADLAEAQVALRHGDQPAAGLLPEVKALEARLHESIEWFGQRGIQLKGIAPVIIDFVSELDGDPVLLCWLEGEASLDWYHTPELGFMGRRRIRAGL
ncbi:MAG: DUF2203 domain-containing protein [Egibacteraceae bacterium]